MRQHRVRRQILFADLAWIVVAFFAAGCLRDGALWKAPGQSLSLGLCSFLVAAAAMWSLLSAGTALDCFRGEWRFPAVVAQTLLAVFSLMFILLPITYLKRDYEAPLLLGYFGVLLFGGCLSIRYLARSLLLARRRTGQIHRVAVVGGGRVARELALKISRHPEMLWEVVGFIEAEDGSDRPSLNRNTTAVPAVCVVDVLRSHQVSDVIVALATPSAPAVLKFMDCCRQRGITVSIVPQPYELYRSRPTLANLGGIPIVSFQDVLTSECFARSKRIVDLVLGILLSVVAVPILLVPVLGLQFIKGRALCWELRCGRFGTSFAMLRLNVDRCSPTATRFERALEVTSITELPQLWNVLRGEMSLVGPRPEPWDRVCRYTEWQRQRLTVMPGMTGLAQVHGLRDQHLSEEKARLDLQYILNCSHWTDLSLLLQTFWTLATRLLKRNNVVVGVEMPGAARHAS